MSSEKASAARQKWAMIGAVVALVAAAAVVALTVDFGAQSPGESSRRRTMIDSQTGELFEEFYVRDGTRPPWKNPSTGTETLYPADACYWNRDGTAKLTPTWVFVKERAGIDEDTFCPDCGRLVVPHNPMPPDQLLVEAAEREKAAGGS